MRIGTLAKKAQCSTETIRFYEKQGLLPEPSRTYGNYRQYQEQHLNRLKFIRNCRSLDMTHDEIRNLLHYLDEPQTSCEPINKLLDEHIEHVATRISELKLLRDQLANLRQRCVHTQAVPDCGIVQGLANMKTTRMLPSSSHLS